MQLYSSMLCTLHNKCVCMHLCTLTGPSHPCRGVVACVCVCMHALEGDAHGPQWALCARAFVRVSLTWTSWSLRMGSVCLCLSMYLPGPRHPCGWAWSGHCTSASAPWRGGRTWSSCGCETGHWSASCGSCAAKTWRRGSASWCLKRKNDKHSCQYTLIAPNTHWSTNWCKHPQLRPTHTKALVPEIMAQKLVLES